LKLYADIVSVQAFVDLLVHLYRVATQLCICYFSAHLYNLDINKSHDEMQI